MKKKDKLYVGIMLIILGLAALVFGFFMQNKIPDSKIQFTHIFGVVFIIAGIKSIVDYRKA